MKQVIKFRIIFISLKYQTRRFFRPFRYKVPKRIFNFVEKHKEKKDWCNVSMHLVHARGVNYDSNDAIHKKKETNLGCRVINTEPGRFLFNFKLL